MDKWRCIVVVMLSIELTFLGSITALGKVTKETSYGLEIIYMALGGALAATLVMKDVRVQENATYSKDTKHQNPPNS